MRNLYQLVKLGYFGVLPAWVPSLASPIRSSFPFWVCDIFVEKSSNSSTFLNSCFLKSSVTLHRVVERSWSLRIITYLITISMWQINYKWLSKVPGKMVLTLLETGKVPVGICAKEIQCFPPFLIFKHTHRYVRLFHLKSFRQTTKRRLHSMQCSVCVSIFPILKSHWSVCLLHVCYSTCTFLLGKNYWTFFIDFWEEKVVQTLSFHRSINI